MSSTITTKLELSQDVTLNLVTTTPPKPTSLPTLLFLHYWGGSSRTWSKVIPLLSDTYPTIAVDLRGWGSSTGPDRGDGYTTSLMASDIQALITQLHLSNYILIGLSMGAKIAQLLASQQPLGLRSLILLSPAPPTPLHLDAAMSEQQIHAYDSEESASFVSSNVLTASGHPAEEIAQLVEDQLRGNEWARRAWPLHGMGEDISEAVREIGVPVLVLAAERDVVEPLERVKEEVCGRIKGAEMSVVERSGHLSPVDAAETVAREIRRFARESVDKLLCRQ